MDNFCIEKMQLYEINEVADVLTDSFETNPVYSSIFNETDFREGLYRFPFKNLFYLFV
jgi:hypothetical protein